MYLCRVWKSNFYTKILTKSLIVTSNLRKTRSTIVTVNFSVKNLLSKVQVNTMRSRKKSSQSNKISNSSHNNYRYLQRGELKDRLNKLQTPKSIAKRQNDQLWEM